MEKKKKLNEKLKGLMHSEPTVQELQEEAMTGTAMEGATAQMQTSSQETGEQVLSPSATCGKNIGKGGLKAQGSSVGLVDGWVRSLMKFFLELWEYMVCALPDALEQIPVPQGILEGQYDPRMFSDLMELLKNKGTAPSPKAVGEASLQDKMDLWLSQEATAKELYPNLDLREELKDPRFVELLDCGIDVRTAFEIIHKDQILCASMHFAAAEVERRLREKQHKDSFRPTENGGNQGPAISKQDVSRMSRRERKDLIRRAQMGEVIRL